MPPVPRAAGAAPNHYPVTGDLRLQAPSKPPMRRSPSSSPRSQRTACVKPLLMYMGIGLYTGCLLFWWLFLKSDANRVRISRWSSTVLNSRPTTASAALDADAGSEALLETFARGIGASTPELLELHRRHGIPDLKCVGWRQTTGCDPDGPREPKKDLGCGGIVLAGASGYCLLRDENSGREFQSMRLSCTSLRPKTTFKCSQAVDFVRVAPQVDAIIAAKTRELGEQEAEPGEILLRGAETGNDTAVKLATAAPTRGIVMVVYPKLLQSVHAHIRLLRGYGCTLPVEMWFLETEMGTNPLDYSRILQSLMKDYGPVTLRGISDELVVGFTSKVYALAHSDLDQLLFLDADNAPVKDPTYLFDTPEFLNTGALFWPDFWNPANTIFNIKATSLIWELVGTEFVDMFEQESGQLMLDRRRTAVALHVTQFLAMRQPRHFERLRLSYGDKDLFRLAWLKTKTPFHMIVTPPAAAGMVRAKQYCGMTMVQYDTRGEVIFLHRNGKKLSGEEDLEKDHTWGHMQSFIFPDHLASVDANPRKRYAYVKKYYNVSIFQGGRQFVKTRMCYGDRYLKSDHFRLTPWEDLPWHDLEDTLLAYARDASQL
jgi:alpha 1,2-mannosyltransferase